jgi:hypothetical protein
MKVCTLELVVHTRNEGGNGETHVDDWWVVIEGVWFGSRW